MHGATLKIVNFISVRNADKFSGYAKVHGCANTQTANKTASYNRNVLQNFCN